MKRRSGSLLIVTLWLVTILSALSVAIARYLSLGVKVSRYRIAREEAKALARSGVYVAMQRLALDGAGPESDGKAYDWPGDDWAEAGEVSVPGQSSGGAGFKGRVTVRVVDEERKLNLNTADKTQLAPVVKDEALAQAILDARDEPDPAEDQPGAQPPYFAKNGPFKSPEELADLPGMTPEAYADLRNFSSPYIEGSGKININTAPLEVLRAMGLTEATIQMIDLYRTGPDGPDQHAEDGVFTDAGLAVVQTLRDNQGVDLTGTSDGNLLSGSAVGVSSQTFTISAEGVIERPAVRIRVDAVVRRAQCPDHAPSPCVVAWREG